METEFTKIRFPRFVGRAAQLDDIRQFIEQDGTVVVNMAGAGGVGKTAILREIHREFQDVPFKLVTDVIDFSHTVHRVESWILEQIVTIHPERFRSFRAKMREAEKAVDPLARLQREHETYEAFIHDYNVLATSHRIILLFDTVELVQETPLFEFILSLVRLLENTVLILAGRRNDESEPTAAIEKIFGEASVRTFRLQGFSELELQAYFSQAEIPFLTNITEDLRQNISLLSEGNPIKIALSLDWLDRGVPEMVELTQMPVAELLSKSQVELQDYKQKFENALMAGVRSLQKPINEVIIYMAHFNKRFNRQLVEFFFPEEDASVLLTNLRKLPFVKYTSDDYFVLHDEMTRMVQSYVWDTIEDPEKTLRRVLSEKICAYYERELAGFLSWAECSEQEKIARSSFEVEQVYYRLYADFYSGYKYFEPLYEKLVEDRRSGLAGLAVNFLREFENYADYSVLLKCFVEGYYSGGILLSEQKFEAAEEKLAVAQQNFEATLAVFDWKRAKPIDWHLRDRQYKSYHQLGYCYRSLGNWAEAKKNYQLSLNVVLDMLDKFDHQSENTVVVEKKYELLKQVAETLNSLANVHRLIGDYYDARLLCQTGILLRNALKLDTVMSQYVMAMIFWEMGATAEAVACLRSAEKECADENKLAIIKKYHAYILFRAGLYDQAQPKLKEAEAILRRKENLLELTDCLNILCRLYRDIYTHEIGYSGTQNYWEQAQTLSNEAYQLSVQVGDQFRQAESHLTQAILYYQWSKTKADQADLYRNLALNHWRDGIELAEYRYYQLGSLYHQLRADIAFDEKDYQTAFQHYFKECVVSTHFKHAVFERAIDHVGDKLRVLGAADPALARHYIEQMITEWQSEAERISRFSGLVVELLEVKKAIEENEKIQELEAQHEQAMLDGRWEDVIEYSNRLLEIPSLYRDARSAELTLVKSRAAHREENLSEARRLAKVSLQIGKDLKDERLIGNASLVLTAALWDATSTAEAAAHLRDAHRIFQLLNDEVGLARVKRYRKYFEYRTGIFEGLLSDLEEVAEIFKRHSLFAEYADVKNLMSRITRTNPSTSNLAQAGELARDALEAALLSKDTYRIAECYVSLAILAQRERKYDQVLKFYDHGVARLPARAHSMRAVYEGIRASAFFEQGLRTSNPIEKQSFFENAFESYGKELIQSIQAKPASMARTTGLIFEAFMKLTTAEELNRYTQQVETQVAQAGHDDPSWARPLHIVQNLCAYARQYYPYARLRAF